MIENEILDVAEATLSALTPTVRSVTSRMMAFGDSETTTSAYAALKLAYSAGLNIRGSFAPQNKLLFLSVPSGSVRAVSWAPATGVLSVEDSASRGLSWFAEDKTGVIWAVGATSGLYKRTAVGAWTCVLSDSGAGAIVVGTADGNPYYRSSTGNWYVLSAGTASVATCPVGFRDEQLDQGSLGVGSSYNSLLGASISFARGVLGAAGTAQGAVARGTYVAPLNANDSGFWNLQGVAYGGTAPLASLDAPGFLQACALSCGDATYVASENGVRRIPVLGASGWWLSSLPESVTVSPAQLNQLLQISNVLTGNSQYLGKLRVPRVNAVNKRSYSTVAGLAYPVCALWDGTSLLLDCVAMAGATATDTTTSTQYGILRLTLDAAITV